MFKKILCMAFVCLLAVSAIGWAQMSREAGETGDTNFTPPAGGSVLYDQTDSASGNGAPDQDFEVAFDAYDTEGADDFEVTFANGWDITGINTVGTTGTGPAVSVNVAIYADDTGAPAAAPMCDYPGLTSFTGNDSLSIDLVTPCTAAPGIYWVAIQVQQDFGTAGQHFWSNRSVQSGNPSQWRNPLDGFGTGCTDWDAQITCGVGGGASPDFLFQVVGNERAEPVPTTGTAGLALLLAALMLGSLYVLRRRLA